MRIRLKRRRQRQLIEIAKRERTWGDLSKILKLKSSYIKGDLKKERRLLSEDSYKKLCSITNKNFDNEIIEKLEDNWGKRKGGKISIGNTKTFSPVKESKELAELFGIILGDGHLEAPRKGIKNKSYAIKIAGHLEKDMNYLSVYVSRIIQDLFKEKPSIKRTIKDNAVFLVIHGKNLINFLNKKGLKSGNKKSNNQGIPNWIKYNKEYLIPCLRGLIDTDGSIHRMSKQNQNLRINYTSYIPRLMKDTRESFIKLGFNPSKIIRNKQIFLSRKEEVAKYIKEIEFRNEKHLNRLKEFNNQELL